MLPTTYLLIREKPPTGFRRCPFIECSTRSGPPPSSRSLGPSTNPHDPGVVDASAAAKIVTDTARGRALLRLLTTERRGLGNAARLGRGARRPPPPDDLDGGPDRRTSRGDARRLRHWHLHQATMPPRWARGAPAVALPAAVRPLGGGSRRQSRCQQPLGLIVRRGGRVSVPARCQPEPAVSLFLAHCAPTSRPSAPGRCDARALRSSARSRSSSPAARRRRQPPRIALAGAASHS